MMVIAGLVAVTAIAWVYIMYDAWSMQQADMATMWMPPTGTAAWAPMDFFLVFVMWTVMMVAMMTPSAAPMVMMFATVNRQRRAKQQPFVPTAVFLAGYLIAWAGFSAAVTFVQWPLHAYTLLTPMMDNRNSVMAAVVLMAAGVYQWTPLKNACLKQCRSPLTFIMTQWREGTTGALNMGIRHGIFCVGCCWVLMLVLFAVGVMNMLWVAVITAFVLMEKIAPLALAPWVNRLSGLLLIVWGLWMIE